MIALVVIVVLAAAFVGAGGPRALGRNLGRRLVRLAPGLWRPGVGVLALLVLLVGCVAAVRGEGWLALGAVLVFGVLATTTRRRPGSDQSASAARSPSLRQAAARLGLEVTASAAEVRAAHARLIRTAHPDRGGSGALAAELNAARDTMLGNR